MYLRTEVTAYINSMFLLYLGRVNAWVPIALTELSDNILWEIKQTDSYSVI